MRSPFATRLYQHVLSLLIAGMLLFPVVSATGQTLTEAEQSRLDAQFQSVLAQERPSSGLSATGLTPEPVRTETQTKQGGSAVYGAAIYTSDVAALRNAGIEVNSEFPDFVTARVTASDLLTLAQMSEVDYVSSGTTLYPTNDVASGVTGADALQNSTLNNTSYTGQGALVCVIDTGIDWDHEDFRSASSPSNSRIRYIWDQTLSTQGSEQTPAQRGGSDLSGFDYGVEYSRSDIESAFGQSNPDVRTQDTDGHGTHVAGTAVATGGAHPEQKYQGMAPEADLIVVKAGNGRFPFSNVIDGMNYCGEVADDEGRPVVVNMSLGTPVGPHDGTSPQARAVDNFVGSGQVAVISAGNDGNSGMHYQDTVPASSSTSFNFNIGSFTPQSGADNDDVFFDVWFNTPDSLSVTVIAPGGQSHTVPPDSMSVATTSDGAIFLSNQVDQVNNDRHIQIRVFDQDAGTPPASGTWTVQFTDGSGNGNAFHSWFVDRNIGTNAASESPVVENGKVTTGPQAFAADYSGVGNSRYTIGSPGTATQALTVGAWTHRQRWYTADGASIRDPGYNTDNIASFSSRGPLRGGTLKPEITAPGEWMASALSGDVPLSSGSNLALPGGKHWLLQGTSMSAPTVAGAVALLFQEDASLSGSRVKSLITNQATTDGFTGSGLPNNTWGYGKLDVFRAMAELTGSPVPEREVLAYDENAPNSSRSEETLGGTNSEKLAVRVTPNISGSMTGALLHLSVGDANGLTDSLNVEVWDDNGSGLPGTKQGNTIKVPPGALANYSWNYIPLTGTGVSVSKGTDYHIVIYPDNPADSIDVYAETQSVDGRSSIMSGGSSTRLGHSQAENPDEWVAPKRAKQSSWSTLSGKDLAIRGIVSSTSPSNLVVDISSLGFTLEDPTLPTPVRFVANVSVENNGEPVRNLTAGDFTVQEDGSKIPISGKVKECSLTPPGQGGGTRLADIVFIVDNSGSMGFEQDDVLQNIRDFIDELRQRGVRSALGLTRYGQSGQGDLGQTDGGPIFENQGNLTTDGTFFENNILTRNVTGGGTEPGYFAIEQSVSNFTFRAGAKKVFIAATDETPAQVTSLADINDARQAIVDGGVTLYASTESRLFDDFRPLTDATGGQVFDIFDPFANTVANAITSQTSTSYVLSCLSPTNFAGTSTTTERQVEVSASVSGVTDSGSGTYDPASRPRILASKKLKQVTSQQQPDDQDLTVEADIQTFSSSGSSSFGSKQTSVSAQLFYRKTGSGNPYKSVSMTETQSGTFEGSIPQSDVGSPGMDFYIRASDGSGSSVTLPSTNAATEPISAAVTPNEPPTVNHDLVENTTPGQDLTLTAEVSDNGSVSDVTLFYRMQGDLAFSRLSMSNTSGDTYETTVPGDEITSAGIEYFVRAEDNTGVTNTVGTRDNPLVELDRTVLAAPGPNGRTLGLPTSVDLTFNSVFRALQYEVQWSPDSSFTAASTDTSVVSDTSLTVSGLSPGTTYYWRVRPVRNQPGPFSAVNQFSTYPDQVQANVSQSFNDPSQSSSYRMVALPGDRSTGVASVLEGTPGKAWQAYRDDGSDLISFEEGQASNFTFEPGAGYWVLSKNELNVSDAKPTVSIGSGQGDFQTTIPLHDGWNIISNPLDRGVAWSQVVSANGGGLQTIWSFDGSYSEAGTFSAATQGEAYYFLNDQGLDELVIPYPSTSSSTASQETGSVLVLKTFRDGRETSTAKAGLRPSAEAGIDQHDQFAPPTRFESTTLRFVADEDEAAKQVPGIPLLAHEYRAAPTEERTLGPKGHTFDVRLESEPGTPVQIQASGLKAFKDQKVSLLNPSTGQSYNLHAESEIRITPRSETTSLKLLLGNAEYVGGKRQEALPEKVKLHGNYPNPFSGGTTISYALPEEQKVRIEVYDIMGRRIAVLADERQRAGTHRVPWNGQEQGQPVASGVYLIRLKSEGTTQVKKMTVVR